MEDITLNGPSKASGWMNSDNEFFLVFTMEIVLLDIALTRDINPEQEIQGSSHEKERWKLNIYIYIYLLIREFFGISTTFH